MKKMSTRGMATGATQLHAEWKGNIHMSKLHLNKKKKTENEKKPSKHREICQIEISDTHDIAILHKRIQDCC